MLSERDKALAAWHAMEINGGPDDIEGDNPSDWSAGADWAHTVYLTMREGFEYGDLDDDAIYSRAAESLPTYTHEFWQAFTDTCAYTEADPSESFDTAPHNVMVELAERAGQALRTEWESESSDSDETE